MNNQVSIESRVRGCLVGLKIGERMSRSEQSAIIYPFVESGLRACMQMNVMDERSFMDRFIQILSEEHEIKLSPQEVPFGLAVIYALTALLNEHDDNLLSKRRRALTMGIACGLLGATSEYAAQASILLELMKEHVVMVTPEGIHPLRDAQVRDFTRAIQVFCKDRTDFVKGIEALGNHDMLESPLMLSELRKDPFLGALATYLRHPTDPVIAMKEAVMGGEHAWLIGSFVGAIMGFRYGITVFNTFFEDHPHHIEAHLFANKFIASQQQRA